MLANFGFLVGLKGLGPNQGLTMGLHGCRPNKSQGFFFVGSKSYCYVKARALGSWVLGCSLKF
jgi:hypothetical protein